MFQTTNLAEVYVGTAKVKGIVSAMLKRSPRPLIKSEAATDGMPEVLGVGSPSDASRIDMTVHIDDSDTNGQVALVVAYDSGVLVENVAFYPTGKSAGAKRFSGSVYVSAAPDTGSAGNTNKARTGSFVLNFIAEPTPGVEV